MRHQKYPLLISLCLNVRLGFLSLQKDLLAIQHTFYALSATHQLRRIYPVEPCTQPAVSGVDLYCYHPNQYAMCSRGAAEAMAVHAFISFHRPSCCTNNLGFQSDRITISQKGSQFKSIFLTLSPLW